MPDSPSLILAMHTSVYNKFCLEKRLARIFLQMLTHEFRTVTMQFECIYSSIR